jgi:hypothetical protein
MKVATNGISSALLAIVLLQGCNERTQIALTSSSLRELGNYDVRNAYFCPEIKISHGRILPVSEKLIPCDKTHISMLLNSLVPFTVDQNPSSIEYDSYIFFQASKTPIAIVVSSKSDRLYFKRVDESIVYVASDSSDFILQRESILNSFLGKNKGVPSLTE